MLAEEEARVFLQRRGFEIVERNFFARYGEIDIIAQKEGVLHFVEVKSGENFEPIYNITSGKLKKLERAIKFYILKKSITQAYCLDALIVKGDKIDFFENITLC